MIVKRNSDCDRCKLSIDCKRVCDILIPQQRSDVMVIGETPRGRGDSGDIRRILKQHGITNAYFVSAVNCEPPKGKKPTDAQIKACRYYVQQQIKACKPRFVLLLGNSALFSIKDVKGINKERGRPFEHKGIIYLATWSPGMIFHDPAAENTISGDIKLLADIIQTGSIPREKRLKYEVVMNKKQLMRMLAKLRGEVAFDLETSGLFPWARFAKINIAIFATKTNVWIVPIHHTESPWFDAAEVVRMIDRRIRTHRVRLITHNGKFDYVWMKVHFGVDWQKFAYFDTMIAHYLLDENARHGLKDLAAKYLQAPDWDVDRETKTGGQLNKMALYGAHDGFYTLRLKYVFAKLLCKEPLVRRVFHEIMMPTVRMFVQIEFNGVYVDRAQMGKAEIELNRKIKEAKAELDTFAKINWGSPQQVAKLLYEDMKLPIVEQTKTGNPSVSESVLMRTDHPIAGALLRFRGAKQQLSFFIEGWKPYLVNGWLHPSFKLHGTVTGRLSCENPNLQQVPRDGFIRSLITAPPGWEFLEADLSQIELRIAAELANARSLIKVFTSGGDAHWLTALTEIARGKGKKKEVLFTGEKLAGKKVSYDKAMELMLEAGPDKCIDILPAWKELRKKAKAVNFGYLFGMWWKKFKIYARDNYGVDVTDEQAQDSRENFFGLYPELEGWHRRQKRTARTQGYVVSLSGRRRRLPAALSPEDTPARREAERQSINSPVQSFANELNLMTAIQLSNEYGTDKVKLCGTVHDSIIFLVKREYVKEVHDRVVKIMRRPKLMDVFDINMRVPIEGEVKIGAWSKGVSIDRWLSQSTLQRPISSSRGTRKTASRTYRQFAKAA